MQAYFHKKYLVDQVIAIAPDKRTKLALEDALKKNSKDSDNDWQRSTMLLDAGQCVADEFDWNTALVDPEKKLFPDS
jgi:hypothetical protein